MSRGPNKQRARGSICDLPDPCYVKEISAVLGISRPVLYLAIAEGKLRAVNVGAGKKRLFYLVRRQAVADWLDGR